MQFSMLSSSSFFVRLPVITSSDKSRKSQQSHKIKNQSKTKDRNAQSTAQKNKSQYKQTKQNKTKQIYKMPPLNVPHRYLHTPLHQQSQQQKSQQQQQQQFYLHSPSSPSPLTWTGNIKNFLQSGHNETEDSFADDAMHWCE
jgi:glucan-binding YG repeat protein